MMLGIDYNTTNNINKCVYMMVSYFPKKLEPLAADDRSPRTSQQVGEEYGKKTKSSRGEAN